MEKKKSDNIIIEYKGDGIYHIDYSQIKGRSYSEITDEIENPPDVFYWKQN